jgi:GWxTD domain-containing protein
MMIKKTLLYTFFFLLFLHTKAEITAYFSKCVFNTPDNKPYVETYLSVLGKSIAFKKNANGKFQGAVEMGILFFKEGQIKASKKYTLLSPELNDTLDRPPFIDQQRFQLDTGVYELEMLITDKSTGRRTFSIKEKIIIDFPSTAVNISDIEPLVSFSKTGVRGPLTKNGFDLIPYTSDFFPENSKELVFYAEVYNTNPLLGQNEKFLIGYYIESYEKKIPVPKFALFRKETTQPVNILLSRFSIAELPSGNYNLVVEVKNKNNEVVARKKMFFQRKNFSPRSALNVDNLGAITVENTFASRITGKDTLAEVLGSLWPIATEAEKKFLNNQMKLANIKLMQQFFYNFWQSRSQVSPENAWNEYSKDVRAVNSRFGTFSYRGYQTDRGRVYLQYGPPDKMELHPSEPNAYPYEIWVYYKLNDKSNLNPSQTNKQFIFFNRDLISNNYEILHSDAQSEQHDSNWQMKLHARTVQSNDFEHKESPEHYGGNSRDEFNNPH